LKIFVDKNKVTGFMTWEPCWKHKNVP
jgi:hypothetical protein